MKMHHGALILFAFGFAAAMNLNSEFPKLRNGRFLLDEIGSLHTIDPGLNAPAGKLA